MRKVSAVASVLLLGLMLDVHTGFAQAYPSRPLRFVSSDIGGASDTAARLLAAHLSESWGQAVVVENRNLTLGGQIVAQSSPDGYSALFSGSTFWTEPLFQKMPFDPAKDFAPVTMVSSSPALILVQPAFPAANVTELIALAKSKPGQLNFGTASTGSSGHLAAELLKSMAGINIVRIQYKGASQSLTALMGGEVQMSFASAPSGMPYVKTGRLRALAVTSARPSAVAPGIPTVASAGLPGYEVASSVGMFVVAKTSRNIITQLNRDVVRVLVRPDVKEKILSLGSDVVANSPEQFGSAMKSEVARIGKLVKEAGLRTE